MQTRSEVRSELEKVYTAKFIHPSPPYFHFTHLCSTGLHKVSIQAEGHAARTGPTPNPTSRGRNPQDLPASTQSLLGIDRYGLDAADLCLVLDVVLPSDFKTLDFDKYKGSSFPKTRFIMYCRKMTSYIHDDKLLIYFFQDNLSRAMFSWYVRLERGHIWSWKDLAEAFLKRYKYNEDMTSDRTRL
ncbi:hypothetical protein CR513_40441, partial [Mucuna pruriens]